MKNEKHNMFMLIKRYFYAKMDLPPHQFFSGPENDFNISYEKWNDFRNGL